MLDFKKYRPKTSKKAMSEKLEPQQKRNSEFLKPCFLEKIRKNWSLKFGRTGVDRFPCKRKDAFWVEKTRVIILLS